MVTNNPKISLYVPQQIYDRFKKFQKEKNLTMSQAGIAILAEYFGLSEETKKNVVGGVTLEAFEKIREELEDLKDSLVNEESIKVVRKESDELKQVKKELEDLKQRVNHLETKSITPPESEKVEVTTITSEPLKAVSAETKIKNNKEQSNGVLQLNLLSEPQEIKLEAKHLAQRLHSKHEKVTTSRIAGKVNPAMKKGTTKEFIEWTKKLDPDRIGWDVVKNPNGCRGKKNHPLYYYVPHKATDEQIF